MSHTILNIGDLECDLRNIGLQTSKTFVLTVKNLDSFEFHFPALTVYQASKHLRWV